MLSRSQTKPGVPSFREEVLRLLVNHGLLTRVHVNLTLTEKTPTTYDIDVLIVEVELGVRTYQRLNKLRCKVLRHLLPYHTFIRIETEMYVSNTFPVDLSEIRRS